MLLICIFTHQCLLYSFLHIFCANFPKAKSMFVIIDTLFECMHLAFSNLKVYLNPSTGTYVLLEDYDKWRNLDQTFSNDLFLLLSFLIENLNSRPLSELKLSIVNHTICHNCHNYHNLTKSGVIYETSTQAKYQKIQDMSFWSIPTGSHQRKFSKPLKL